MLKYRTFLSVILCLVVLSSCKKTDSYNAEAQLKIDDKLITDFLAKNPTITAVKHSSGIYYQIINPGTGDTPTESTQIKANYEGRLLNGTIFDKSNGAPITFTLGQVITGWQIGIPLVKEGGSIRLLIPSYYAYQDSSPGGGIPANAVLDFTIDVVNVQ